MEPKTKKASIRESQEIGERMHQSAMQILQNKQRKMRSSANPEESELRLCSFKPNISKKTFVKYPNPSYVPLGKSFIYDKPGHKSVIEQIDNKNKYNKSKKISVVASPKGLDKVKTLSKWWANRSQKLKKQFLQTQMSSSCELRLKQSKARSRGLEMSRFLSSSLQNLVDIKGSEQFKIRLQKATILKRDRQYRQRFPESYIWNYRKKHQTSMDSTPIHYLSFGESTTRL